jgi:hypothetical protein
VKRKMGLAMPSIRGTLMLELGEGGELSVQRPRRLQRDCQKGLGKGASSLGRRSAGGREECLGSRSSVGCPWTRLDSQIRSTAYGEEEGTKSRHWCGREPCALTVDV